MTVRKLIGSARVVTSSSVTQKGGIVWAYLTGSAAVATAASAVLTDTPHPPIRPHAWAVAITGADAVLASLEAGRTVYTRRGFCIRLTPKGITVSKGDDLGAIQRGISWPLSLDDARDLAPEFLAIVC